MGWVRDDGVDWHYDHEGYIVAQVKEDGDWRDLGRGDEDRKDEGSFGLMLQVACTCGWRSQRQTPPLCTRWGAYYVSFRGDDEDAFRDAAAELWDRHMLESSDDSRRFLVTRGNELEREYFENKLREEHRRG